MTGNTLAIDDATPDKQLTVTDLKRGDTVESAGTKYIVVDVEHSPWNVFLMPNSYTVLWVYDGKRLERWEDWYVDGLSDDEMKLEIVDGELRTRPLALVESWSPDCSSKQYETYDLHSGAELDIDSKPEVFADYFERAGYGTLGGRELEVMIDILIKGIIPFEAPTPQRIRESLDRIDRNHE